MLVLQQPGPRATLVSLQRQGGSATPWPAHLAPWHRHTPTPAPRQHAPARATPAPLYNRFRLVMSPFSLRRCLRTSFVLTQHMLLLSCAALVLGAAQAARVKGENQSCCMIRIEGSCSDYSAMSDRDWFNDAHFGGPKIPSASTCEQRHAEWQRSCGGASNVHSTFKQSPCAHTLHAVTRAQSKQCMDEGPRTAEELPGNARFLSSREYKEMAAFIGARHDIADLRQRFSQDGYVVFKPEIPESVLAGAAAFTEKVFKTCITKETPAPKDQKCGHMHQDKFTHVRAVRQLAMNYHIRAMLAALHKHDPFPFQTLNYPCTSLARTHSDYVHFAAQPLPLMAAAWVALIDVDPAAGPVFYYPRSHKLDAFNMQDFGLDRRQEGPLNYAKYQDIMNASMERAGYQRKLAIIPRGHCLIWAANLVHGGPPADTQKKPRFSQVTHYFFRGASYMWAPV